MSAWDANDPAFGRPLAAPLEQCAQLLGVDLTTMRTVAADVEPYLWVDGTKVWSLMQLERRLRSDAYGRVRGGYLSRRRVRTTGALCSSRDWSCPLTDSAGDETTNDRVVENAR